MGIARYRLVGVVFCGLLCVTLLAVPTSAAAVRSVPAKLATILQQAQQEVAANKLDAAWKTLGTWQEPPHPLHCLLQGHVLAQRGEYDQALAAYEQATALDPTLREATIGRAHIAAQRSNWQQVQTVLAQSLDPAACSASELALYARATYELNDKRLAQVLVERGMIRFPDNPQLRKLDLALLFDTGRFAEASSAALDFLRKRPQSPLVWRYMAHADQQTRAPLQLATLEAAMLGAPTNRVLKRQHMVAQHHAGHHNEALLTAKKLVGKPPRKDSLQDIPLMEAAIRIAEAASDNDTAQGWITRISPNKRSRTIHRIEARLALKAGNTQQAKEVLNRIVSFGDASPSTLVAAGQLSESTGDEAAAEIHYRLAASGEGAYARLATLHLARLLKRMKQPDQAAKLLQQYLIKHPTDRSAQAMLKVVSPADARF